MPAGGAPVRPVVSGRYHVEVVPGDAVVFAGENATAVVRDAAAQHVVPLIDGRRTTREIAATLASALPARAVHETLASLVRSGLVGESAGVASAVAALWAELGVGEFRVAEITGGVTIGIEALHAAPLGPLYAALADYGLAGGADPSTSALRLVVCDDYLDPRLAAVDARARATGQPWLPVKPTGVNVWVGPLFVPGSGACWHCLADRLRRNRPADAHLYRRHGRLVPLPVSRARSYAAAQHAFSIAATQVARWAGGIDPTLSEALVVFESLSLIASRHLVQRRPQCEACGDPEVSVPAVTAPDLCGQPVTVVSRDGGERAEAPEATFERYAHLVSPLTGVVSAVRPSAWNAISPLRSYGAGHNYALAIDTLRAAADSLRSHSSGKGRSGAQARTSALCEALERFSGLYTGAEPAVSETLDGLGDAGIDPRECMLFSERQYRERDRWLASGSPFQIVPRPFDPAIALEWSPLWSLTGNRVRYLPTSYLYYGYPYDEHRCVAWADSNGCAAGATFADACLSGLYELIERDGVALWWYNRVRRPRLDVETLDDPWIEELRAFLAGMGREFWLLDLTSDLGIPTAAALTRRLRAPAEEIVMGFGAHHDPVLAVQRALTEMNQFLPTVLPLDPTGATEHQVHDRDAVRWWRTARVADQPYLEPLRSAPATRLTPVEQPLLCTPEARFRLAVQMLERRGFEVLVLDQTRPDVGLPVARVIVPGLRHFWARFAPGRLFDVPVELGWVPAPTEEGDLNPIAMFL